MTDHTLDLINASALTHPSSETLFEAAAGAEPEVAAHLIRAGSDLDRSSNYIRAARWLAACGKFPTTTLDEPNEAGLSVQIGCHLEEFAEFLDALNIQSPTGLTSEAMQEVAAVIKSLGINLKLGSALARIYDREAALDALCDSEVTSNGVAYMAGFDKPEADRRVLASNESKLEDGRAVILAGGKIGKGRHYIAPDLSDLV